MGLINSAVATSATVTGLGIGLAIGGGLAVVTHGLLALEKRT